MKHNTYSTPSSPKKFQPNFVREIPREAQSAAAEEFKLSLQQMGILKFLLDMKFAKVSQVLSRYGESVTAKSDIEALLGEGLIKCKDQAIASDSLLVPTEKAYELLTQKFEDKKIARPIKRIFEPAVNHDLTLVDLRLRFESLNFIKKWNSEKMLEEVSGFQAMMPKLPDAVCEKNDERKYFLELEISAKSPKDYVARIEEYKNVLELESIKAQKIDGVIFVCVKYEVWEKLKSIVPKNDKRFSVLTAARYLKPLDETEQQA